MDLKVLDFADIWVCRKVFGLYLKKMLRRLANGKLYRVVGRVDAQPWNEIDDQVYWQACSPELIKSYYWQIFGEEAPSLSHHFASYFENVITGGSEFQMLLAADFCTQAASQMGMRGPESDWIHEYTSVYDFRLDDLDRDHRRFDFISREKFEEAINVYSNGRKRLLEMVQNLGS